LREKSLLEFLGKPLLELQLEKYVELGFRSIVVVCNPDNQNPIRDILAKFDQGVESQTFVQHQPRGMGDALLTLEPMLGNVADPVPVYVCQVHDIFDKSLHEAMVQAHFGDPQVTWLASYQVEDYFPGGYLVVDDELNISNIIEKPPQGEEPSDLVNIVAHVHPDLRRLLDQVRIEYTRDNPHDDHYERAMAELMDVTPFKAMPYKGPWHPIKYPWHVLEAMNYYLSTVERHIADGVYMEDGVYISGPVYIEEGVRLLHGADIRGPVYIGANSLIGQYANVRESMVSQNSIVGIGSEVNRSYIGRGARLHTAKALDAILADNAGVDEHVNLSAGMITANFRADAGPVKSTVKGQRLDTGRDKLGAVIGAGSFIGIGAMLMPGVKIGEGCFIGPLTLVLEDVPDNTLYYSEQKYVKKQIPK
jgi:bifunctional UDP-N-acetylglucosamine pyrophosphorylase/glucosamine-1-phosphate N-acetyltransferase